MHTWRQQVISEILPQLHKCSSRPLLWAAIFNQKLPAECHDRPLINQVQVQQSASIHLPFYGLLAKGWDSLHQQYCQDTNKTVTRNWLTGAIKIIWQHLHKEWQSITDKMHSKTDNDNPFHQSLHYQARNLYKLASRVPPQLRTIYFPDDINTWLIHSSTITISNWIKAYGKRIRKAVAQYEQRPPHTLPLTAYFRRIQ